MLTEVNIRELALKAVEYSARKEQYSEFLKQLINKSLEYWESNDFNNAIQSCNEFIQLEPERKFGFLFKSLLLTCKKKFKASDKLVKFISSKDLDKTELEIFYIIQSCNHFYTNQFQESIKYCTKLIENGATNNTIYLIRGMAYAGLEKHKIAIKDFKTALKDKWEVNAIKASLAYSYLRNGNRIRSLLTYRKIVNHFPEKWEVQYNTGLSYFKLAFFKKALKYLNKTEELNPDFPGTYLTRGYIYLKKGFKQKALNDWNKAKELGEIEKYEHVMNKYYNKL